MYGRIIGLISQQHKDFSCALLTVPCMFDCTDGKHIPGLQLTVCESEFRKDLTICLLLAQECGGTDVSVHWLSHLLLTALKRESLEDSAFWSPVIYMLAALKCASIDDSALW